MDSGGWRAERINKAPDITARRFPNEKLISKLFSYLTPKTSHLIYRPPAFD